MGHEHFALSYGSWHQEMVMGQKRFEEDRVKGKLRIEGAMFRVLHGTGHYIIGNNENTGYRFRNKSHIAISEKESNVLQWQIHEIWASEVIGRWPGKGGGRKEGFNIIRKKVIKE